MPSISDAGTFHGEDTQGNDDSTAPANALSAESVAAATASFPPVPYAIERGRTRTRDIRTTSALQPPVDISDTSQQTNRRDVVQDDVRIELFEDYPNLAFIYNAQGEIRGVNISSNRNDDLANHVRRYRDKDLADDTQSTVPPGHTESETAPRAPLQPAWDAASTDSGTNEEGNDREQEVLDKVIRAFKDPELKKIFTAHLAKGNDESVTDLFKTVLDTITDSESNYASSRSGSDWTQDTGSHYSQSEMSDTDSYAATDVGGNSKSRSEEADEHSRLRKASDSASYQGRGESFQAGQARGSAVKSRSISPERTPPQERREPTLESQESNRRRRRRERRETMPAASLENAPFISERVSEPTEIGYSPNLAVALGNMLRSVNRSNHRDDMFRQRFITLNNELPDYPPPVLPLNVPAILSNRFPPLRNYGFSEELSNAVDIAQDVADRGNPYDLAFLIVMNKAIRVLDQAPPPPVRRMQITEIAAVEETEEARSPRNTHASAEASATASLASYRDDPEEKPPSLADLLSQRIVDSDPESKRINENRSALASSLPGTPTESVAERQVPRSVSSNERAKGSEISSDGPHTSESGSSEARRTKKGKAPLRFVESARESQGHSIDETSPAEASHSPAGGQRPGLGILYGDRSRRLPHRHDSEQPTAERATQDDARSLSNSLSANSDNRQSDHSGSRIPTAPQPVAPLTAQERSAGSAPSRRPAENSLSSSSLSSNEPNSRLRNDPARAASRPHSSQSDNPQADPRQYGFGRDVAGGQTSPSTTSHGDKPPRPRSPRTSMHTDPQTATEPATLQEGEPHPQSAQRYLPSTVARASHQEPSIVGPYQSSESDVSEYFTPPDPEVIAEAGPDPTNPILPENKSVGERGGYASRTVREDIFAAAATAKANVSAAVKETRLFKHVRKSPVVDAAIAAYRKGKAGKKKLFGSKKLRGVLAAVSAVSNGMSEAGYEAGREQAERSSPPGATPLRRGTSTPKLSPAPTPIYEKEIASAEEIRKVIKSAYAGSMGSGATKVNDSSDWRSSMSTKRSASPHSSPLFGARNR